MSLTSTHELSGVGDREEAPAFRIKGTSKVKSKTPWCAGGKGAKEWN